MVLVAPYQPFNQIPDELIVRILIFIPTRERLVLEEVNKRFNTIVRWMLRSSEVLFRHKFIHRKEPSARKSLLRYSNMRLLNMDIASGLFSSMSEEERGSFACQLSESCPLIQTVYLSHRSCFEVIAAYCQHLGQSKIQTVRAVVSEDKDIHILRSHLRTIRERSPLLKKLWIILCPAVCEDEDHGIADDLEFSDKHDSDFEVHDDRMTAIC